MMGCWSWLHYLFFDQSQLYIIHHAGDGPETQDRGENDAAVLDIFWVVVSFFFQIFTAIWGIFPFWLTFFKGVEPPTSLSGVQIFWVVLLWSQVVCISWAKLQSDSYHIKTRFKKSHHFFTFFPSEEKRQSCGQGPVLLRTCRVWNKEFRKKREPQFRFMKYIYNPWN